MGKSEQMWHKNAPGRFLFFSSFVHQLRFFRFFSSRFYKAANRDWGGWLNLATGSHRAVSIMPRAWQQRMKGRDCRDYGRGMRGEDPKALQPCTSPRPSPLTPFLSGIDHIVIAGLLCDAAVASNATHATDERVFVHPVRTDGRSPDKIVYS